MRLKQCTIVIGIPKNGTGGQNIDQNRNKKLVIIGNGNFAELIYFYVKHYDVRKVSAFSVEREYINQKYFLELPVCPLEQLAEYYPPEEFEVLLAIGAKNMNRLRERLFRFCEAKGYGIASFVHPTCVISPDAQIGKGNILLENVLIQPFVKIGDGNLFWDNISISHNDTIGSFNTVAGGVGFLGFDVVGNHCYLGKYSMIFNGITIADYTLVGAGAYVKRNTKEYDVIVPARSITLEHKKSTDFQV